MVKNDMNKNKETVILLSGGIDSIVAAYLLKEQGFGLIGVYVDLGIQTSKREKASALYFSNLLRIPLNVVSYQGVGEIVSSLGNVGQLDGGDILDPEPWPDIKAENESKNRVSAFYNTVSSGIYISRALDVCKVAIGIIKDDLQHRPNIEKFLSLYADAVKALDTNDSSEGKTQEFILPCLNFDKSSLIKEADRLKVQLDATYSCIQGRTLHCGVCGSCKSRKEAFKEADIEDPTWYEASPNVASRCN